MSFNKRPKKRAVREFYFAVFFMVSVIAAYYGMTLAGWLQYYLLLFFIPTRICQVFS